MDYAPATVPTMYFIGVTTGASSINRVFPRWVGELGLGDARLVGMDFRPHDEPGRYRRAVAFIRDDPLSLGALVTTHKMDLFAACGDLFDEVDPLSASMGEVSSIYMRDDRLLGRTVDPVNAGRSLDAFLPRGHWGRTGGEACVLGAGGSSFAFTWHLLTQTPPGERPTRVVVTNRSLPRLEKLRAFHASLQPAPEIPVEYRHCPRPEDNDAALAALPPGSLVVNATGLGKDAPGSPLTDAATFPRGGIAWDFNYRGDLLFLRQARAQQAAQRLLIEDGWTYFIHGWSSVMADVFDVEIPSAGPLFERLSALAGDCR